jgi:signal transduction histidine kinase
VTDADALWAEAYKDLIRLAAHEIKGALNGIALNLEVLRSRIDAAKTDKQSLAPFAEAAYQEFETLSARTEAHLFLARPHRGTEPADVAVTLKHMATMLVPAARSDGVVLEVGGYDVSVPTSAPASAVRVGLATGLLTLIKEGGGRCRLEPGAGAVVRFSHQSATACSLGPVVTSTIAAEGIRVQEDDGELTLVFPQSE